MKKHYWMVLLFILLGSTLGCGGSKPSRYYLLSELKLSEADKPAEKMLKIGIGPIRFPEYLKRPQIGIFLNKNQLNYAEYDRWAEPLDENFLRVLSENLSKLLQTDYVYTYPFIGAPQFDYQLILDVREFLMDEQDLVSLSVQWQIIKMDEQESISTHRTSYIQKANPDSYSSLVRSMSQTIEDFSREIAENFTSIK